MRARLVIAFALLATASLPARAENQLFVVANNPDGYGVDRCLATGAPCGRAIASAYCQSRDFQAAVSYRKVEREQATGLVMTALEQSRDQALVAIECVR
ncbi:MAG TPA: hypothetical protein VHA70_05430 [Bauldia sp.]|nr:hypothetical protein [Bauldia sp.]